MGAKFDPILGALRQNDLSTLNTQAQTLLAASTQAAQREAMGVGFALQDVANNAAKLALTGISAGHLVRVTGEAGRIEQYIGPVHETATGNIVISGLGEPTDYSNINGKYLPDGTSGGKVRFTLEGGVTDTNSIVWSGTLWNIFALLAETAPIQVFESNEEDVATPDLASVWNNLGYDGSGTIVVEPESSSGPANDDNWVIIGTNTYELLVHSTDTYETETINGVTLANGVATSVGWVKEKTSIPIVGTGLFPDPATNQWKTSINGELTAISYVNSTSQYHYPEWFPESGGMIAPSFVEQRGKLQIAVIGNNP